MADSQGGGWEAMYKSLAENKEFLLEITVNRCVSLFGFLEDNVLQEEFNQNRCLAKLRRDIIHKN